MNQARQANNYQRPATPYFQSLRKIYRCLYCLNRRRELRRLSAWAKRKRLKYPLRAYETHIGDVERKLLRYQIESPHSLLLARLIHHFNSLLNAQPRYLPKGSAAGYKFSRR